MRALTNNEWNIVAGGMVPVIGPGGFGGGSSGGASGGGSSGGSGTGSVTDQELKNAMQTVLQLYEGGEFGTTFSGTLFSSLAYANMSGDVMVDQINYAELTCRQYENSGDIANEHQVAQDELFFWDNVDFSVYSHDGSVSCKQAVMNMFTDIIKNHRFSINALSPDLERLDGQDQTGGGGGGGGGDRDIYRESYDSDSTSLDLWLQETTYVPEGTVTVGELHQMSYGGYGIDLWDRTTSSF